MTGPVIKVREIPNVGFEVVRWSPAGDRSSVAFRLSAEDANEEATNHFARESEHSLLDPPGAPARLELWEIDA